MPPNPPRAGSSFIRGLLFGSILSASGRTRRGERLLPELPEKRLTKSRRLRTIEQLFVKCAVRANPRTKGNMDVDMADSVRQRRLVLFALRNPRSGGVVRGCGHKHNVPFPSETTLRFNSSAIAVRSR